MELRLSCSSLVDGKVVKAHIMIPLSEIVIIDSIDISKNDRRLRVRAIHGDYVFNLNGALNVIEQMLSEFGFWRADNTNLINMTHVDKVVNSMFKPEVIFTNTEIRGEIAAIKVRVLKQLFPHVPLVSAIAI
ncbi:LytTR family transcriptional regulator DNA-binding domain-containing protein [Bacillus sp. 3255]|uniref:LytTR family transcriptional regulator DNA-binding domain-containing protein n=1 Tax=Bacillus sp. 3255 TaxID=2817904 RepID=UPI002864BD7D|nr:LytTR family transcriptional regulator DNA-binding domain-containing protein [Bacillus sp. 3255]MDR6883572.1 hypothetical protein [Bacillus sp. 3255]